MKYLLIDTNIFLDMIIARDQSHKPESYNHLLKLLNHGEVQLLVPEIIKTEVFRHLSREVDKIQESLKFAKTTIENLYWINNNEELNKFNDKLKPIKNGLKDLVEEYSSNKGLYIDNSDNMFNELFNHKNTKILSESNNIVMQATKRKIHKLRPFHYGKDKDSIADAIIIETLVHIKELIDFKETDSIYFISRNPEDFSLDKKENIEKLHTDILESFNKMDIKDRIHYRIYFTKTLLKDFEEEIENIGIKENLLLERELEIQEMKEYWLEMDRESVGLISLTTDYDEILNENKQIEEFFGLLQDFDDDLLKLYDEYVELYMSLREELYVKSLDEIASYVENFNSNRPLFEINTDHTFNKEDYIYEIFDLINNYCIDVDYVDIDDMLQYADYYEGNSILATIKSFDGHVYNVESEGYITPNEGGMDTVEIIVTKDKGTCVRGYIELIYGFVEIDENNNVGNSLEDSIDVNIEKVTDEIKRIQIEVLGYITDKKGILERFIGNLGILLP